MSDGFRRWNIARECSERRRQKFMFHFSMQNIDVSLMKYKETYIHK
jgi:hypothetical protein